MGEAFRSRARLFQMQADAWTEKGMGDIVIVEPESSPMVRIRHYRERTQEMLLDAMIMPDSTLTPAFSEADNRNRAFVFEAQNQVVESRPSPYAVRFKSEVVANRFFDIYNQLRRQNRARLAGGDPKSPLLQEPARGASTIPVSPGQPVVLQRASSIYPSDGGQLTGIQEGDEAAAIAADTGGSGSSGSSATSPSDASSSSGAPAMNGAGASATSSSSSSHATANASESDDVDNANANANVEVVHEVDEVVETVVAPASVPAIKKNAIHHSAPPAATEADVADVAAVATVDANLEEKNKAAVAAATSASTDAEATTAVEKAAPVASSGTSYWGLLAIGAVIAIASVGAAFYLQTPAGRQLVASLSKSLNNNNTTATTGAAAIAPIAPKRK